jgi:dihydroxyacid dehydratase/phosphogluconate dehydratase
LVNCNVHFRALASAAKRGVARAGGLPVEFPSLALGEQLMKPTAMLFRNLAAIEVEELIRANPLDAVVLLAGCEKTVPAQLMGVAIGEALAAFAPRTSARGPRHAGSHDTWLAP